MSAKEAYRKYLQTDTWKTIRAQRLAIDNNECVLCGNNAEHVHHRRYPKVWGTETIKDLVCLCGECHKRHHGKEEISNYYTEELRRLDTLTSLSPILLSTVMRIDNLGSSDGSGEYRYYENSALHISDKLYKVMVGDPFKVID